MNIHYIHAEFKEIKIIFSMTLEQKLRTFFRKYDPSRLRLAKQMARNFRGQDDAVMKHLTKVYATGGPAALIEKGVRRPKKKREIEAVEEEENLVLADAVDEVVEEEMVAIEETIEDSDEVVIDDADEDSNKDSVESIIDDLDD
jgi:hypothetical protein